VLLSYRAYAVSVCKPLRRLGSDSASVKSAVGTMTRLMSLCVTPAGRDAVAATIVLSFPLSTFYVIFFRCSNLLSTVAQLLGDLLECGLVGVSRRTSEKSQLTAQQEFAMSFAAILINIFESPRAVTMVYLKEKQNLFFFP